MDVSKAGRFAVVAIAVAGVVSVVAVRGGSAHGDPERTAPTGAVSRQVRVAGWVAYEVKKGRQHWLAIRALEGGKVRVIPWSASRVMPVWSPDGTKLAFWTYHQKPVYVINRDGSGLRRIASPATIGNGLPTDLRWSPDGTKLAISTSPDCSDVPQDVGVYVATMDGKATKLAGRPARAETGLIVEVGRLEWSPDGRRLLYNWQEYYGDCIVHDASRNGWLWASADGRESRELAVSSGIRGTAAWAPDGRNVAFGRARGHGWPSNVAIVGTDHGAAYALTRFTGERDGDTLPLRWTRDGRFVVFVKPFVDQSGFVFYKGLRDKNGKVVRGGLLAVRVRDGALSLVRANYLPWDIWISARGDIVARDDTARLTLRVISRDGSTIRLLPPLQAPKGMTLPEYPEAAVLVR